MIYNFGFQHLKIIYFIFTKHKQMFIIILILIILKFLHWNEFTCLLLSNYLFTSSKWCWLYSGGFEQGQNNGSRCVHNQVILYIFYSARLKLKLMSCCDAWCIVSLYIQTGNKILQTKWLTVFVVVLFFSPSFGVRLVLCKVSLVLVCF